MPQEPADLRNLSEPVRFKRALMLLAMTLVAGCDSKPAEPAPQPSAAPTLPDVPPPLDRQCMIDGICGGRSRARDR